MIRAKRIADVSVGMAAAANFRQLARRIICVGRNYRDPIVDSKIPLPTRPILFMKSSGAFIDESQLIRCPPRCQKLLTEVEQGLPWFLAKSFDSSCPVAGFLPKAFVPNPEKLELMCIVNGVVRQNERASQMIFDIPTLIEFTSSYMTLEAGDVMVRCSILFNQFVFLLAYGNTNRRRHLQIWGSNSYQPLKYVESNFLRRINKIL